MGLGELGTTAVKCNLKFCGTGRRYLAFTVNDDSLTLVKRS